MKRINIPYLFFFIFLFFLFSFKQQVFALENYDIEGNSTYTIEESGVTHVVHKIKILNKKSDIYPTQYALSIPSTNILNIWSKDDFSNLEPTTSTLDNQTTIQVKLINHSVGEGQVLNLTIGYEDYDICENIGRIWEINISKPENVSNFKDYKILLDVPKSFGNPIISLPESIPAEENDTFFKYEFTQDIILKNNITYIFGEKQVFVFNLHYSIENTNTYSTDKIIALPPDTNYQKLFYDFIVPKPDNIDVDANGNWLANYKLNANQKLYIFVEGKALVSLKPEFSHSQIPLNIHNFLNSDDPWQTDDPEINKLAQDLKTPSNIYDFIVDKLQYNYQRINDPIKRYGSLYALNNSENSMCMEFTDLFIALARAASIPSRELNGFAYTNNPILRPLSLKQDILHAWPEYYDEDKKIWIPVDPTWEKTTQGIDYFNKFDLNHLVFVIHGTDSSLPLPAGFYKTKNSEEKDVIVYPSNIDPIETNGLILDYYINNFQFPLFSQKINIIIENSGNTANYQQEFRLSSDDFQFTPSTVVLDKPLLPHDSENIPIKIKNDKIFSSKSGVIKVETSGKTYETKIEINAISNQIIPTIAFVFMGIILIKISQLSWRIFFRTQ